MTRFVHLLTTAVIFVHAAMGCCAHESRGISGLCCEPSGCCQSEQPQSEQPHSAGGGHQHGDHESQQPVPHACHQPDCQWPAPEAQSCADLMLLNMFLSSTNCIQGASLDFVLGNGFDSFLLLPDLASPTVSLRAHLAKCVLLI